MTTLWGIACVLFTGHACSRLRGVFPPQWPLPATPAGVLCSVVSRLNTYWTCLNTLGLQVSSSSSGTHVVAGRAAAWAQLQVHLDVQSVDSASATFAPQARQPRQPGRAAPPVLLALGELGADVDVLGAEAKAHAPACTARPAAAAPWSAKPGRRCGRRR